MNKIIILFAFACILACKSQQKAEAVSTGAVTNQVTPANKELIVKSDPVKTLGDSIAKQPDSFRVVVSFISIGAGTDPDATALLNQYLTDYSVRNGLKPDFQRIAWGREGEVDNCFQLKEMDSTRQKEFIEGLKKAMYGHNLIQIQENMRNRFRR